MFSLGIWGQKNVKMADLQSKKEGKKREGGELNSADIPSDDSLQMGTRQAET